MSSTDRVQRWREATVAIVNADATLRTLCGRTTGLIVPWDSLVLDGPLPVIAYQSLTGQGSGFFPTRLRAQFSAFGQTENVCNHLCERLNTLLVNPAYTLQGMDVGRDNASPPDRQWPDADPRQDDAAIARADIDITFFIAG